MSYYISVIILVSMMNMHKVLIWAEYEISYILIYHKLISKFADQFEYPHIIARYSGETHFLRLPRQLCLSAAGILDFSPIFVRPFPIEFYSGNDLVRLLLFRQQKADLKSRCKVPIRRKSFFKIMVWFNNEWRADAGKPRVMDFLVSYSKTTLLSRPRG